MQLSCILRSLTHLHIFCYNLCLMRSKEREDVSTIISITVTFLYRNSHEQDTDPLYLVATAIIMLTD